MDAFREALRLKPDYTEARFNLGLVYWQLGRKDEARAEQQRLKAMDAALAGRLRDLFKP